MADTQMNGEVFEEDQKVTITGDEVSDYELKISELSDDLSALEKEKNLVVEENKSLNDTVKKVKESVENLSAENEGLKAEVEQLAAENKTLHSVAARASELEGDVARTQHEMISTMSALQEANQEISGLKSKLAVFEGGESDLAKKLESAVSERDLLVSKIAKLESTIEELNMDVIARDALVKKVVEMEEKLAEKEKVISGLESDGEVLVNGIKDRESSSSEESAKEGSFLDGVKMDWPVIAAVSTVATVAVLGSVCYLQYARRK